MSEFPLLAATPPAWVDEAARRWHELLADHADCEKKAASTAIALMFSYSDDHELCTRLSRLAREELRHFEQVDRLMREQGVTYPRRKAGRYAAGLRAEVRTSEPARKLDLMLAGALIEARSCERFGLLAGRLPEPVGALYAQLRHSEARHFELYLRLAERHAAAHGLGDWRERLAQLARVEAGLATAPDPQFRFHSGPPELQ